jgi:SSS family solute:Na+ symporter
MSIPIIAALGLYALAILAIAFASLRSGATMENFLVAGRKQRKLLIVASMLASTVGGGITIGTIQKASVMGFPAFWFVAAGGIAHLLQGLLLSRKVRESEAVTMADLADKTAGAEARLLTSIIVLVTWIGIAAAQFSAAARVLSTLVGVAHPTGVVVAAVFIVVYTLIGGQKSVLRTDLFQAGLLAVAVVATAAYLYLATPPASPVRIDLFTDKFGPLDLLYYVVVLGGSYFICPMMFSRILSADTPANARKSSFLSGAGMFGFALILTFIGLWVTASGFQVGKLDPLNAIAKSALPPALGVLLVMGLLAAIVSTADTVILTASSIAANDLLKRPSVAAIRLLIVAVGVVAAGIALFQSDVIVLLVKTYNGYTAGLVPALFVSITFARFSGGEPGRRPAPLVFAAAIVSGYALGVAGSFAPIDTAAAKILPLAGMVASAALALISYRRKG